jgi:hypothetical protein
VRRSTDIADMWRGVQQRRWTSFLTWQQETVSKCLAAELVGRHYGGGVLKLEPSEAIHLPVFRAGGPELLNELDLLAREKGLPAARARADEVVLRECLGLTRSEIKSLVSGVAFLQAHRGRQGNRRSPSHLEEARNADEYARPTTTQASTLLFPIDEHVSKGRQMAKRTILVSDLTGKEIDERDAATVTIRYADARRGQVVLDVNASEVDDLASSGQKQARRGRRPKSDQ